MQINVAQLLKSAIGAEREYEVDEDVDIEGQKVRVTGKVHLIRTDRGILARGSMTSQIEIECSRCLEPFQCPVDIKFEEEFFPLIDVISGLPVGIPEEQSGYFIIDQNHIIDLREAIRQYILLAVPMKPLCKEECAGLCSNCGKNLNQGCCDCATGYNPET
jgi:uncharacterized protein